MMDHYDVIIIGTGAGGGTLAHRLAPTGKRILLLERGGYLPARARELGQPRGVPQGALPQRRGVDRQGRQAVPARTSSTSSAATRSSTARSSSGCASATSARSATTAASRRRGRSPTTTSSPTTPRPSGSTSSTASAARTRPSRRRSGPFPYPAVSHEPRIQQLHDDFARPAITRSTCPVGVDLDESDPEGGRCVRCDRFDGFPCLTDGKADAHVCCVRPGARARRTSRCARTPACSAWRPTPAGARSPRSSSTAAAREERYSADVVVVSCGAVNSAALLLRSAVGPPPARAGQLLRRGRPPLHGAHQLGRDRDLAGAEHDQLPEDARRQRLLLGRRGLRLPARAHPDARQDRQRTSCAPARPWFAPGLALDYIAKHAIDFWLTTEDLPHPDNRVTVDRSGQHPRRQGRPQHRAPQAPAGQAQGPARPPRLPRDADPELVGPRPAHPARRRRAPVRHGALRQRPGHVGARRRLQGPRPRQPVRRRHELLPLVQRGEPGADGDGERAARRRPPASSGSDATRRRADAARRWRHEGR